MPWEIGNLMPEINENRTPLVHLHDVTLKLNSSAGVVNILNNINLQIDEGTNVSVVGPSGSGKTSLMMLISGLERQSNGIINVAGHNLASLNEDALARFRLENLGIIFQNFHLIPTMTAIENISIVMELNGLKNVQDHGFAALKAVGLQERSHHYPEQLSGGEQQRVALARAIAGKPRLILADEPTGNLDADASERVMNLLFSLCENNGATLIVVTHDVSLANRCERLITIEDGSILTDREI
tara:strand:+ start:3418 stop:4143 length:726 start_codon:yes stop_codon:yes gene_type:complete